MASWNSQRRYSNNNALAISLLALICAMLVLVVLYGR